VVVDPSHCGGNWSPIIASGPQSALAGVLAGFVFTAMTVVLSTNLRRGKEVSLEDEWRAERESKRRSYALQLFAAAFVIFAVDSYFLAVASGELACNRAYAESVLSGGTLGTGAILTVAGLAWLIAAYFDPGSTIGEVILYIIGSIWLIVVVMLIVSGIEVGESVLGNRWSGYGTVVLCVLGMGTAAMIVMLVWTKRGLEDETEITNWVRFATLSGIGSAVLCGLLTGVAAAGSAKMWIYPPASIVYGLVILAIMIPAIPLFSSVPSAMAARVAAMRDPSGRPVSHGRHARRPGEKDSQPGNLHARELTTAKTGREQIDVNQIHRAH
jgi:hypothetical protein